MTYSMITHLATRPTNRDSADLEGTVEICASIGGTLLAGPFYRFTISYHSLDLTIL